MTVFARFASHRVERVPTRRAQRDNGKSMDPSRTRLLVTNKGGSCFAFARAG